MTKHVAFIGLGYIGLPTAVVMANSGLNVTGVDVMKEKVELINRGEVTIVEPGLESELKRALKSGRFKASTEVPVADVYIVAVPTPFADSYEVDMRFIYSAAEAIAPKLQEDALVILESTSPPQTTEKMARRIIELRPDLTPSTETNTNAKGTIFFAHCPERILPGKAMEELRTNDRIIGGMSPEATERAKAIYASFCKGELLGTNDKTAEMAKLTENSFRDVNIAFANELSLICDGLGINVWELIELANHHPRVNILQPGPGVGGHCIAVDPWFIVSSAPETARLIKTAREVNDQKPNWVVQQIEDAAKSRGTNTIGILGLAFKANIDDLRESPALEIAISIAERFKEFQILVAEPNVSELPESLGRHSNVQLTNLDDILHRCEVLALLVDHNEFRHVTEAEIAGKKVIDTRGAWPTQPANGTA